MTKTALAAALLALAGTALVTPSSGAADPPLPEPTVDIADGGSVSELQAVVVTDLHPNALSVRLEYDGLAAQVGDVDGDSLTFHLETWGLPGTPDRELVVSQCRELAGLDCGVPAEITTTVVNPVPTPQLSRPSPYSHPFELTVSLPHSSGSPRLKLTTDGAGTQFVNPGAATTVEVAPLNEGPHAIDIAVCSADDTRCTPTLDTVPFDVVHSTKGTLSVSAPAFSPNGDKLFDTVDFLYTQQDVWDSAELRIYGTAEDPVFESPVALPVAPSDSGSYRYRGRATGGAYLANGSYTATLVVSRTVDGQPVESTYDQVFNVDTVARAPAPVTPTFATFYPYVDGYRDTVRLAYTRQEPYSRVDLKVRNSSGTLVRSKRIWSSAGATWNGRRTDGSRAPAGTYSLRLRVVDRLGNVGLSPQASVTVRNARIVKVLRSVTVTPKASKVGEQLGACSTLRTPSLHGWPGSTGYLSNTRCQQTSADSIAWTHNKVELQRAAKYFKVRLGWYGGPTRAATHDQGHVTLYGPGFANQGTYSSLDYLASQALPWEEAARVVVDGEFHWGFQTGDGNRYDVKSFTITYQAGVLR